MHLYMYQKTRKLVVINWDVLESGGYCDIDDIV